MTMTQSAILQMPTEIRLAIYDYLFDDQGLKVFEMRNQDPQIYNKRPLRQRRKEYRVLGKDMARRSIATTYQLLTPVDLHPQIMAVCKQIHEETFKVLYGNRHFSFDRDIEAVEPFFSDLSPSVRPLVHGLCLTKQGAVYERDFDRCVWSHMCGFLRDHMQIRSLRIVVDGGRPRSGWEGLPEFSAKEFNTLQRVAYDQLDWVWELLTIRGVQDLQTEANITHGPPAQSNAMAFFVAFSATIETGFRDFLSDHMIQDRGSAKNIVLLRAGIHEMVASDTLQTEERTNM